MSRKNIAVMDFGSSHITVLIGERGVNGTFDVRGYAEMPYAGYLNGEILEPEKLSEVLCLAIKTAQNNARVKISHLYVGVPGEFSVNEVKSVSKDYGKQKKITSREVDELFLMADDFASSPTHIVINRSPVCFELDNGDRVIDPKGESTTILSATLSFMLAERTFVGAILQALEPLNLPYVDFLSEPLAECMYLISPEERDNSAILVDCGYLSTSVSIVVGDGIVCMRSFSLGGGHIVADICEMLNVPFGVAQEIKQRALLAGKPSETEEIVINADKKYAVSALGVYEIVDRKIRQIAKMIVKSLNSSTYEKPEKIRINLTGGGISYIKGARERLFELLGKDVTIREPKIPLMNEPNKSAVLGLLDLALRQNQSNNSLLYKIFSKK